VAKEMQFRRSLHYPPFALLTNVVVQSEKMEEAAAWAAQMGRWFERQKLAGVRVLGPAAAPIVKLKRIYRFHFILKAERRAAMSGAVRKMLEFASGAGVPRRNLVVDVDAMQLM
jgi:primosomal protein N' (replication factor Y)